MDTVKPVTHYRLLWSYPERSGSVALITMQSPSEVLLTGLTSSEMLALADLLRNERPVFWDSVSQTLFTRPELVGEEELD